MIGTVLLDRYRLEEKIGVGGMAMVFRATDLKNSDTVAVKILKPEYNADVEFVRRFQREAIAAQTMLHPNIVKVMDVGEQNNLKFIVMEYVDGITIKETVAREGALDIRRTIDYAIQIARALEHAHRCHIIHRDIKSQNILVDKRGIIKVADFGIARATNSTTVTASDSGVLGSVHYFSPEQARGEIADEKSDIYSLGVVVYEMATGQLPFDADQPVTVALKHIQQPVIAPSQINPLIPPALDDVIIKALSKNKNHRYRSAIAMEVDLSMVLAHPEGGFVVFPKVEHERRLRSVTLPTFEEPHAEKLSESSRQKALALKQKNFRSHILTYVSVLIAALLLLLIVSFPKNDAAVQVTSCVALTTQQAVRILEQENVNVVLVPAYSSTVARDTVISQEVSREKGRTQVTLTVSSGPESVRVADLAGLTLQEAQSVLYMQGLTIGTVEYGQTDLGYAEGDIFDQTPRHDQIAYNGESVNVVISLPVRSTQVPKVLGLPFEAAKYALEQQGLAAGNVTQSEVSDVPEGTVISQSPSFDSEVLEGSSVDLVVAAASQVAYAKKVSFSVEVPSGGGNVKVVYVEANKMQELLSEKCAQGKQDFSFDLQSLTGQEAKLTVYLDEKQVQTIPVLFDKVSEQ